jgi:hypothetical protein
LVVGIEEKSVWMQKQSLSLGEEEENGLAKKIPICDARMGSPVLPFWIDFLELLK